VFEAGAGAGLPSRSGGSKTARICSLGSFGCACPAFSAGKRACPPKQLPPVLGRQWFAKGEVTCSRVLGGLTRAAEIRSHHFSPITITFDLKKAYRTLILNVYSI
jgi:hypothetical protein